jgi:hypothetical protein
LLLNLAAAHCEENVKSVPVLAAEAPPPPLPLRPAPPDLPPATAAKQHHRCSGQLLHLLLLPHHVHGFCTSSSLHNCSWWPVEIML